LYGPKAGRAAAFGVSYTETGGLWWEKARRLVEQGK